MHRPFYFWCQKVLPLVYDQSLSYYEVLCKLVEGLNGLLKEIDQMQEDLERIPVIEQAISEMQQEIEKIKTGEYIENYIEALREWIDKNLLCLVGQQVKYVFFGLTDDGHFAAYIPQCWRFLDFCTPLDIKECYYGHLILRW